MLERVDKSFVISGATCVKFLDWKDGACFVMVECILFYLFFNFSHCMRCISELSNSSKSCCFLSQISYIIIYFLVFLGTFVSGVKMVAHIF